jgi:hypothetical protein
LARALDDRDGRLVKYTLYQIKKEHEEMNDETQMSSSAEGLWLSIARDLAADQDEEASGKIIDAEARWPEYAAAWSRLALTGAVLAWAFRARGPYVAPLVVFGLVALDIVEWWRAPAQARAWRYQPLYALLDRAWAACV